MTGSCTDQTGSWYCIRVQGVLDAKWADWFGGMTLQVTGEDTLLSGLVIDQAALHGVLAKIRDLGLVLLAVQQGEDASPGAGVFEQEL